MPAYLFNAPTGVPGDITRVDESNAEPAMLKQSGSPLAYASAYGIAMVYATGGITQWGASNVAADFAGVLARIAPAINGSSTDETFNGQSPYPKQVQSLLVRGYISVKCPTGTPARGGIVYIRVVASGGKLVGDFEATADGGNNVALSATQAEWATDGKDADNNAELRVAR